MESFGRHLHTLFFLPFFLIGCASAPAPTGSEPDYGNWDIKASPMELYAPLIKDQDGYKLDLDNACFAGGGEEVGRYPNLCG